MLSLLGVLGLITACEMEYNPQTGQTTTFLTVPGTAANQTVFEQRWRSCTQYASESVCEREFGGRRPPP
jgi:hypothetical protein